MWGYICNYKPFGELTNISLLEKRNVMFKSVLAGDMLVPRKVYISSLFQNALGFLGFGSSSLWWCELMAQPFIFRCKLLVSVFLLRFGVSEWLMNLNDLISAQIFSLNCNVLICVVYIYFRLNRWPGEKGPCNKSIENRFLLEYLYILIHLFDSIGDGFNFFTIFL